MKYRSGVEREKLKLKWLIRSESHRERALRTVSSKPFLMKTRDF